MKEKRLNIRSKVDIPDAREGCRIGIGNVA